MQRAWPSVSVLRGVVLAIAMAVSGAGPCSDRSDAPLCPNGSCDHGSGETLRNCPQDCAELCGDRRCDLGIENADSCPDDCGCGNGRCMGTETPNNCQDDCPVGCGDQVCETWNDEDIVNCPTDCHGNCGDGECDWQAGESFEQDVCPSDCFGECDDSGFGFVSECIFGPCGDGVCACDIGENQARCSADCNGSEACSQPPDRCGNGSCEAAFEESPRTCPADCRCGDGACDELSETGRSCPEDCQCGDGVCDVERPFSETRFNRPDDCTCADGVCASGDEEECPTDCYCGDAVCSSDESCSAGDGDGCCTEDCPEEGCRGPGCPSPDAGPPSEPMDDVPVVSAVTPSGSVGVGGEEVTFDATASNGPTAWSWSFGGGTTVAVSAAESPHVTLGAAGTYTGSVTASNADGASAAYSFMYTVAAAGSAPSITSLYVPGDPRSGATGQFSAIVSDSPTGYAWTFGGGATPNASTAASPSVTFGAPGTYDVSLVASNAHGSSVAYTIPYTVSAASGNLPVIDSVSQTGYLGATGAMLNFNCSASEVTDATWVWDFGTGASVSGPDAQFTAITLGTPGVHSGSVTATTSAGSGSLDFTFLVSASAIQPPTFQAFSVASSPLSTVPPSAILLADGRPLVSYVASSNHIAASISDVAAPIGSASFAVHEIDATPSQAPRSLAGVLLGDRPVLAYLYPDAGDLVLAVSIGTIAPTQTSDWSSHVVLRMAGAGSSVAADVEVTVVTGRIVLAIVTDAGLRMAYAQTALPTASTDWAMHVLDASTTLRDCALADLDGAVVGYLDSSGTLRFAAATLDPPAQTSDWSIHGVETYAGFHDVSMTVMGSSVVMSVTGDAVFGVDHVHRSVVGNPTSAANWESSELGSVFGRHSIITLGDRLAIASMTSTTSAVPFTSRTVLADAILIEGWQFRQLSAAAMNPQMGDAIGLASGRLAFCYVDAANLGSVMFAQADAAW